MRKISELLDIAKQFHISYGGPEAGMCLSAIEASYYEDITKEERYRVTNHSKKLVEEIDPLASYLFEALGLDHTQESDRLKLKDWWEDHINSLKEEGL